MAWRDTYQRVGCVLEKERVIQLALNRVPCQNIDLSWFNYQSTLTRVYKTETTYTTGFNLTESQADYIVRETSPSSSHPMRAQNLSRGSGCTVEALDLRTCTKYEVKVMKNDRDQFIFDWRNACRQAGFATDQEIAFGVYNHYWTDADGEQWKVQGVFFATV